ncbi:MAG: glycoside hydrolase [Ignavibacteria bacterium]|nr:glycoside hydrolase [Ignavibacteria bacterium]
MSIPKPCQRLSPFFAQLCILCSGAVISAAISHAGENKIRPQASHVIRHFSIYESQSDYCAWPSVCRTADGDLLVLFTRTEEHLGPDGEIVLCRSSDSGSSWHAPEVIFDTPLDDRESGVTLLADGTILGHIWSTFHTPGTYEALPPLAYEEPMLTRWIEYVRRPEYRGAKEMQGGWLIMSSDGGSSWSTPRRGKDSVHGGIQLANGSLLIASYRRERDSISVHVADSPFSSWRQIASIASPQPDSLRFGEPHVLQIASGRVIMMIRVTTRPYDDRDPRCVLWGTYSDDDGKTWATPSATPLWGFPPHLTQLSDGRVLCTYGYRREPFGQRACISEDGVHWTLEHEVILREDAPNGDLGYPASVELEPGIILSIYYQPNVPAGTTQRMRPPDPDRTKPGILGTVWKIPPRP